MPLYDIASAVQENMNDITDVIRTGNVYVSSIHNFQGQAIPN